MSDIALYPFAFIAGLVSFVSPCVLPLLPGYLSFISGASVQDIQEGETAQAKRIFLSSLLFVLGFALIFSLLGSAFGMVGALLKDYKLLTQQVSGIVIILMGLFVSGVLNIPALYREVRFLPDSRRLGVVGAFPLGMAFAVGWTPCIGPILAAVYSLALSQPGKGASLLLIYSLGLGIPFVVSGLLFSRLTGALNWFKQHGALIHRVSGGLLVVIGILLFTGQWTTLMSPIQRLFVLPI